jgi:hypothetical protein
MFGSTETWKIVYTLPVEQWNNGARGVALLEAESHQHAMQQFQQMYRGQYCTVERCERLLG